MVRTIQKLSAQAVNAAKPSVNSKGKPCAARYSDGAGLYLHVTATGGKSWVYRWKVDGKAHEMGLGSFADMNEGDCRSSLKIARELAKDCRNQVLLGNNPKKERDKIRQATQEPTFLECVERYYADKVEFKVLKGGKTRGLKSEKSRQQFRMTMDKYAKPLHRIKVSQIGRDDVLKVLRPIWDEKRETASRTQGRIERVLSYATAHGWRHGPNPAQWVKGLDNILGSKPTAKEKRNHPALPYAELPAFLGLLRATDNVTARLTDFAILTAARSKQARTAKFEDIDFKAGVWEVDAQDMKGGVEHTVPLCSRALQIVGEIMQDGQTTGLIFPHAKTGKMLSENASRALLIRMDYGHITLHGFRATFKTWTTAKTSYAREVIEMAMAHKFGDDAEMAYLRETAIDKRRHLMQAWSDFGAGVSSGEVVQLHA